MEIKNSRPVLPAVLQSMFIIALGNLIDSSYAPMAPFIKNFYVLTATQVGLVTSVIFIGSSCVSIFTGYFVDRIGYRNAMKLSFGIMAAGSLIVFKSPYYITLLFGFYLIGFGYGVLTPATNSHIMEEYYPEHLTRMGIKQAGVPMGAALASIALPFIVLRTGVPYTYLVVSIMAIFMVLILPYRKKQNSSKFNVREYISEMLQAGKSRIPSHYWILGIVSFMVSTVGHDIRCAVFPENKIRYHYCRIFSYHCPYQCHIWKNTVDKAGKHNIQRKPYGNIFNHYVFYCTGSFGIPSFFLLHILCLHFFSSNWLHSNFMERCIRFHNIRNSSSGTGRNVQWNGHIDNKPWLL
ncbi:MAG: Major facilitator superfamily MFS_1 [Ferroplasma sp. Type II]|nr:MAG: Major facilitator superfamily MFS_1 [Ferroplasma sp. Type II]